MDFIELMRGMRRHHDFKNQEVDPTQVACILESALRAPAVHRDEGLRFVVVDERVDLMKLADAKEHDSSFVAGAAIAIVVVGNALDNECWVEDAGRRLGAGPGMQAERRHSVVGGRGGHSRYPRRLGGAGLPGFGLSCARHAAEG